MANLWCDGFGRYGGVKANMLNGSSGQAWAAVGSDFALSTANPRTGTHHLRMNVNLQNPARRVIGEPKTELFWGFAIYCHALPGSEGDNGVCFRIKDQANNTQIYVMLGTDGALEARRNGQTLARSIPIIGAGAYQHVEIYVRASETDGAIEVRVDEITRLSLTGIRTTTSSNISFSQVEFWPGTFAPYPVIDLADVYVNDAVNDGSGCHTFIGDCKSGWLEVNADTAQADFALSAGSDGFALLGTPPDDATFIDTDATTAESNFALEDGPANLSEILTVRPAVRAQKDDAGTALIAPSLKSNSVKAAIDGQPITSAFAYYDANVPLNPDTAAPWTLAELNAALHVVERVE